MYEPPENRYVLRDLYSQQQAVTRLTLILTIAPNWLGKVFQNPRKGFGHAWPVRSLTFLVAARAGLPHPSLGLRVCGSAGVFCQTLPNHTW
jgi:hypothetical protein